MPKKRFSAKQIMTFLRRIFSASAMDYNQARTHLALQKDGLLRRAAKR